MDKGFTVVLEHMGLALGMGMVLDTMDRILAVALRLGKHSEDFSDTLQLVPSSSFTLEQSTVQYAYMRCTHYTSEHHVHDSRSSIRPLTSIFICNDARLLMETSRPSGDALTSRTLTWVLISFASSLVTWLQARFDYFHPRPSSSA